MTGNKLTDLSDELLIVIASKLDSPKDIVNFLLTSKLMYSFNTDVFWRICIEKQLGSEALNEFDSQAPAEGAEGDEGVRAREYYVSTHPVYTLVKHITVLVDFKAHEPGDDYFEQLSDALKVEMTTLETWSALPAPQLRPGFLEQQDRYNTVMAALKDLRNRYEISTLGMAAQYGLDEVVKLLIKAGANVNDNGGGATPLIWAAKNSASTVRDTSGYYAGTVTRPAYLRTVKVLIKAGAALDEKYQESTALFDAVCQRSPEVVKVLMEAGASLKGTEYMAGPYWNTMHPEICRLLHKAHIKALYHKVLMSDAEALPSLLKEYEDAKISADEVCDYLFKLVEAEDDVIVRKTLLAKAIEKNAVGQPAHALSAFMLQDIANPLCLSVRLEIAINSVNAPLQPAHYGSHTSSLLRISLPPAKQIRPAYSSRIGNSYSL